MPQIDDILRIVHRQSYLGESVFNVFFYQIFQQDNAVWAYQDLLVEYDAFYQATVLQALSNQFSVVSYELDNLTDEVGFDILGSASVGIRPGLPTPSFNAIAVQLNRTSKITRNGSKRFAGLVEEDTDGNNLTMAQAFQDTIETFCGVVMHFPTLGGQAENVFLNQVIIGRTKNALGIYELDLSKVNLVGNASVKPLVTSQGSRKV